MVGTTSEVAESPWSFNLSKRDRRAALEKEQSANWEEAIFYSEFHTAILAQSHSYNKFNSNATFPLFLQQTTRLHPGLYWPAATIGCSSLTGKPIHSALLDGSDQIVKSIAGVGLALAGFKGLLHEAKRSHQLGAQAFLSLP
jgi:hypothetical protein